MKWKLHTGVLMVLLMAAQVAWADIRMVREVTIAPKNGRVVANVGSVNQSYNIRMTDARVDIEVGKVPAADREPATLDVHAQFTLKNEAPETLALTVGFPVSDSGFSAFGFKSFRVETDGTPRTVFNRVTGYPYNMKHLYISGPEKESYNELPDYPDLNAQRDATGIPALKKRSVFIEEKIGQESFHNLMVWGEKFAPYHEKNIKVHYTIEIPAQTNRWQQKQVQGSYKGIWPEEANNLPIAFLKTIPAMEAFYFFDYYLVSGASWKGVIGEEVITLRLDPSWKGHQLYCNQMNRLVQDSGLKGSEGYESLTYTYVLRDSEPTDNLYFALKRP